MLRHVAAFIIVSCKMKFLNFHKSRKNHNGTYIFYQRCSTLCNTCAAPLINKFMKCLLQITKKISVVTFDNENVPALSSHYAAHKSPQSILRNSLWHTTFYRTELTDNKYANSLWIL